jgi:hypothetical protein
MVMESEGGMGGSVRLTQFDDKALSLVKIVTPKHSIETGMTKMVSHLGDVYDYKGLIGMAWVEIGRWLKRKWKNPWNDSKALFCSELVTQVLIDSEYPGSSGMDPTSMDPQMLLEFFEKES